MDSVSLFAARIAKHLDAIYEVPGSFEPLVNHLAEKARAAVKYQFSSLDVASHLWARVSARARMLDSMDSSKLSSMYDVSCSYMSSMGNAATFVADAAAQTAESDTLHYNWVYQEVEQFYPSLESATRRAGAPENPFGLTEDCVSDLDVVASSGLGWMAFHVLRHLKQAVIDQNTQAIIQEIKSLPLRDAEPKVVWSIEVASDNPIVSAILQHTVLDTSAQQEYEIAKKSLADNTPFPEKPVFGAMMAEAMKSVKTSIAKSDFDRKTRKTVASCRQLLLSMQS